MDDPELYEFFEEHHMGVWRDEDGFYGLVILPATMEPHYTETYQTFYEAARAGIALSKEIR